MASTVRKKILHQLDTPFSTTQWPEISQHDQDTILELLCNLLAPIGNHRKNHVESSKGKKSHKRKKAGERALEKVQSGLQGDASTPTMPELFEHIDVGFNSVMRCIKAVPREHVDTDIDKGPYFALFVCRGNQSAAFHSHFPQMVGVSNKHSPFDGGIRLVGFSKPCSEKLSACLGLARVSCIALRETGPGTQPLQNLVQRLVPPVRVPWYNEAKDLEYRKTHIDAIETVVGSKRKKEPE